MATATTAPTNAQVEAALKNLKAGSIAKSDSDQFVKDAIATLKNDTSGEFADNVSKVGEWAIEIDEAFATVTYSLTNMTEQYGGDFPPLKTYLAEWKGYKNKWTSHLLLSRDVASEHVSVLRRFDKVFLAMVPQIQSDSDRLDVIAEFEQFSKENHDRSGEMQQGFLDLKKNVEDFNTRFGKWILDTGAQLAEEAKRLVAVIAQLKTDIESLDKQIQEATGALLASAAGAETMVGVVGLVVSGTQLAILIAQRIIKGNELSKKQMELADVNRKQEALAKIKTEFDGLQPSIALICQRLVMFAEIWGSVKSQTLQFKETLERGMGELNNQRFKDDMELARQLCQPLIVGLTKYAEELSSRKK